MMRILAPGLAARGWWVGYRPRAGSAPLSSEPGSWYWPVNRAYRSRLARTPEHRLV